MASRGRKFGKNAPFLMAGKQNSTTASTGHAVMLKQARKSGQLNLSNRSLTTGKIFFNYMYC